MPPVDNTPNFDMGNFELLHSLLAYNKIPISEYISRKTGLTVVIAEVEGPIVDGYFCLATEAFDDDGLPHTLEHLVFLGSEDYPYKGVLDLLANRSLASGTNAWTDTDHTCYTMETAGSEGFLTLMPIFLDHILYPVLTDEGFVTEVHHITGDGQDAGVVYCEMQGRENSAESRLHLTVARNLYPGKCGYSSETGGLLKNLRESTNNTKVRYYHKAFYRPENLKIIVTGQVKPQDIFNRLAKLEEKIISKGERVPFQRPWQSPVPPLTGDSKELIIKYPADEESNGIFTMAWRGASSVSDLYTVSATNLLLKYMTEFSVSPLPKEFVEIEEPYASNICFHLFENSETCFYITFEDVPVEKLPEVKPKLEQVLQRILEKEDIDMERMQSIINRHRSESLSNLENSPHYTVAFMVIGHMLYGNTKEDLQQRVNPLTDLAKLAKEPKSFWLGILEKYLVKNKYVAIQCIPSREEQAKMATQEKDRVQAQIDALGEGGLKEKAEALEKAIQFNERVPPNEMITCIPIPSLESVKFHQIARYYTGSGGSERIDLSDTPIFTYFDHLKTNFFYFFALLDTSSVPSELRSYLPLLLSALVELPVERDGVVIPYEEVVAQLNDDTVSNAASMGLEEAKSLFKCGNYSHHCVVNVQVEAPKYEQGLRWVRELLYKTVFTAERLKVVAMKMNNSVAQVKRSGRRIISYVMKGMCYSKDSNTIKNGVLQQNKFLTELIAKLDSGASGTVIEAVEKLRRIITEPSNVALYVAGNLDLVKDPVTLIQGFLPEGVTGNQCKLDAIPDYKFLNPIPLNGCVVGLGCLESSFFSQVTKCVTSYTDPDLPALMLYLQYLTQAEGPLWKQIRGKGYSYNYAIVTKVNEGMLYLIYSKATNVVGAYKETQDIVTKQLESKKWDTALLDSARSSLMFEIIGEEKTIGNALTLSLYSYFQKIDYTYNRTLLQLISKVTVEDLTRVGEKYVASLFDPKKIKTAVVTDPAKSAEIATGFKNLGLDLKVYPSLEDSFLSQL